MYDVFLGSQAVGTAQVRKEGLYYKISCRCSLSGETVCKIIVTCNDLKADLGVCVPTDGCFGLDTKLPVKQLGEGSFSFSIVPKHPQLQQNFVPIAADEPFGYLEKLNKACMAIQNGAVGILIDD